MAWLFRAMREAQPSDAITFDANSFLEQSTGDILVWEAFVSGAAKQKSHKADAMAAVNAFEGAARTGSMTSAIGHVSPIVSLAGAALLFAGATDAQQISAACCVIKL